MMYEPENAEFDDKNPDKGCCLCSSEWGRIGDSWGKLSASAHVETWTCK